MNSKSRASAPAPLKLSTSRSMTSPVFTSPRSADSTASRSFSEDDYAGLISSPPNSRKASGSNKAKSPHNINVHSYCGRHSDQYLFGGHSFGELWRSVTKKD
ncbi:hypothetical protein B0H63DRAFT_528520 [Podospora didyma]|uniref:Uncharacterized protein n=1 Tax=Podospora didyma TaxID=330526 RepID=A0AAE0K164_9PEZI|nr:hypothetical protein B0H63DRAFT_528520 [Podospora didyma]